MDLSTHALTPVIELMRIRSLSRLDRRCSPRILSVALPHISNSQGCTYMHFGEYELSPSLISLSPPPSVHPEAFQRLSVRSSSWCYPAFNLAKGRSLGFASATADYTPYSDSLSLRIRVSSHLTLPAKATRRFIMQKARRHSLTSSDRL